MILRSKIKYQEKVNQYNLNPNICKYCNKPIIATDKDKLADVKRKIFCNSSCAASYNNKGNVKNKNGINGVNKDKLKEGNSSYIDKFSDLEIIELFLISNSVLEFCQKLGYKSYISKRKNKVTNRLKSLGIDLSILNTNLQNNQSNIQKCSVCGAKLSKNNKSGLCVICHNAQKADRKIQYWLTTGDLNIKVGGSIKGCIRNYIYKEQNNKCAICGLENTWNGKLLNFVLDHIDGNAGNNKRKNLRLVCPNCDSQLDTFKSKNKNSARKNRNKYYH